MESSLSVCANLSFNFSSYSMPNASIMAATLSTQWRGYPRIWLCFFLFFSLQPVLRQNRETRVSFADPRYKWIRLISRLCFFVGLASLLLPRTFALDRLLSKDFSIGSPSPLSDVLISSLKWFLEREMASERDSKISSISSCRLRRPIFDALYRGDIPRATRARKLIC